jgi:hypothetical protein
VHVLWQWLLIHTGTVNEPGPWYAFWSGFGSDIGELLILGGLIQFFRHHNCHVRGCWRIKTSTDPAVHAPACRRHHSLGHLHGDDQSV